MTTRPHAPDSPASLRGWPCGRGSPQLVVVSALVVLSSSVLANSDVAQLDRRLDTIVNASVSTADPRDPARRCCPPDGRRPPGQVMFSAGFQLPQLPPGTRTVAVNGVDYRVRRTVAVPRDAGEDYSWSRSESGPTASLTRPVYVSIGLVALLIAAGLGWFSVGRRCVPATSTDQADRRLGAGDHESPGDQIVWHWGQGG